MNRTQFAAPNTNPTSTDFGKVTAATEAINRVIQARRVPCSQWKKLMRESSSNRISVAAATPSYGEMIPRRFVIK